MLKKIHLDKISGTKNVLCFLLQTPTHHSFTFNLRFLYELKQKFVSLKLSVGFSIFNSALFSLKCIFLFNKKYGLFDFNTS